MKSSITIPIAIILGGIVVAGAVYFSLRKPVQSISATGNPALVRPVDASDHLLGNPVAPVVVVEYADFDCEFCKDFDDTMNQIIASEGANGQVAWVYREFPLIEIHPDAFSSAEAAECAAKIAGNETFWKFADALFANQPVDPSQYGTLASSAGISSEDFATCFENASSTVDARINADRQNALTTGAVGTPYSLILVNGQPPIVMSGEFSYDEMKQQIDQALSTVSSSTSPSL